MRRRIAAFLLRLANRLDDPQARVQREAEGRAELARALARELDMQRLQTTFRRRMRVLP